MTSLYARVLGPEWHQLAEPVRALHQGTVRATGVFRVSRGSNLFSHVLARWIGFPAAGSHLALELNITASEGIERWSRRFDDLVLESIQWTDSRGMLVERMGPMEFAMELEAKDGALIYHVRRLAMRIVGVRVPLPPFGLSTCTAVEKPSKDGNGIDVYVSIRAPIIGLIAQYEGVCTVTDRDTLSASPELR